MWFKAFVAKKYWMCNTFATSAILSKASLVVILYDLAAAGIVHICHFMYEWKQGVNVEKLSNDLSKRSRSSIVSTCLEFLWHFSWYRSGENVSSLDASSLTLACWSGEFSLLEGGADWCWTHGFLLSNQTAFTRQINVTSLKDQHLAMYLWEWTHTRVTRPTKAST